MIHFLIGLPRSGKSTISQAWRNKEFEFDSKRKNKCIARQRVVIDEDNIRLAMGAKYNVNLEPHIEAMKLTMAKALSLSDYHVLLDDTHTAIGSIIKIMRIDIDAKPYVINESVATCVNRANATNQKYLIPVINRHFKNMLILANMDTNVPHETFVNNIYDKVEEIRETVKASSEYNRILK